MPTYGVLRNSLPARYSIRSGCQAGDNAAPHWYLLPSRAGGAAEIGAG
jgi:hypothetical protein